MAERVGEQFTAPQTRSNASCKRRASWALPARRSRRPALCGTGPGMRPHTLHPNTLPRYAIDAGFAQVEILPIHHDFLPVPPP